MGKSTRARASSKSSKSRGSTRMETETRAPSVEESGLFEANAGEELIPSSCGIKRRGELETKNPGREGRQGRDVSEQTDSRLALFFRGCNLPGTECPKSFHD